MMAFGLRVSGMDAGLLRDSLNMHRLNPNPQSSTLNSKHSGQFTL